MEEADRKRDVGGMLAAERGSVGVPRREPDAVSLYVGDRCGDVVPRIGHRCVGANKLGRRNIAEYSSRGEDVGRLRKWIPIGSQEATPVGRHRTLDLGGEGARVS